MSEVHLYATILDPRFIFHEGNQVQLYSTYHRVAQRRTEINGITGIRYTHIHVACIIITETVRSTKRQREHWSWRATEREGPPQNGSQISNAAVYIYTEAVQGLLNSARGQKARLNPLALPMSMFDQPTGHSLHPVPPE